MSVHGEEMDGLVAAAVDRFHRALTSGEPLVDAICGLDHLCKAANSRNDPAPLTDDPAAKHLLGLVMQVLIDVASPRVSADRIAFGFAQANAMLIAPSDEFEVDRLLYSAELLATLRAHLFRSYLALRGDPIRRRNALGRAMSAVPTPGAPLN